MEGRMIHKNWAELIKPTQLDVKPGNDPRVRQLCCRTARAWLWSDNGQRAAPRSDVSLQGAAITPSDRQRFARIFQRCWRA